MILITGAGGFIGSNLVRFLNEIGRKDIVVVDNFHIKEKLEIIKHLDIKLILNRDMLVQWMNVNHDLIDVIFHLGARTDTTELKKVVFDFYNVDYSKLVWKICVQYNIPLVYASSAATYGDGENGFVDDENIIHKLRPLNPYGNSKQEFDMWALSQEKEPPFWVGLKFFNVYGHGEYNKGRMASVVYHGINQIKDTGKIKLFKSHNSNYVDGGQMRDFVCVDDVIRICFEFYNKRPLSGIYNLGTGNARSFLDLANAIFLAMNLEPNIEFIDTPTDIRDKYQYFTQADLTKLKKTSIQTEFVDLETGVKNYVKSIM